MIPLLQDSPLSFKFYGCIGLFFWAGLKYKYILDTKFENYWIDQQYFAHHPTHGEQYISRSIIHLSHWQSPTPTTSGSLSRLIIGTLLFPHGHIFSKELHHVLSFYAQVWQHDSFLLLTKVNPLSCYPILCFKILFSIESEK